MPLPNRSPAGRMRAVLLAMAVLAVAAAPILPTELVRGVDGAPDHLVVSEVVTGGASASDELIELHNPTGAALPLEGLEVVYVTASGATISRRAAWPLGAPSVPARGHVLVANETGAYAAIADAVYASGMAATGGSVAIRILGASSAIDAIGWGSAASTWLEGTPAPAPAVGASLERLPGGAAGSTQDTDDNVADFVEREVPEPQNLLSEPTPMPGGTASPTPSPSGGSPLPSESPAPSAAPTATAVPSSTPGTVGSVATARAAPDGATVTIEGVALTGSAFHDGGGFVADGSAGIAVLPDGASFERGQLLRVSGEVDDRFSQRTLRAAAGGIVALGSAADPMPTQTSTGAIGEAVEGRLIRVSGTLAGSQTPLTSAVAIDVDDGSGPARIVIGSASGIASEAWTSGSTVELVGVVGQRDSTGSGAEGYRILPRDPSDVLALAPPATSTPTPGSSDGGATPTPTPGSTGLVTIAAARDASPNTRLLVRGVVTLPSRIVDERTAVVQDASGAILLRLGPDSGALPLGALVEVDGTRSTLSGMESLRARAIARVGTAAEPTAVELRTGDAGEPHEARLVVARGAVVAAPRGSSSGTVSFEIDDGSGPLRISAAPSASVDRGPIVAGAWVEVRGVLGQETSRAEPNEGYRIWPRRASDVRIVAPATDGGAGGDGSGNGTGAVGGGGAASLDQVDSADLSRLRIGATLVVGRWRELGIAGLLWDGTRLVALHPASTDVVTRLTGERPPPLALELGGMQSAGVHARTGATLVRLGTAQADALPLDSPPAPPRAELSGPMPAWVSLVGRLAGPAGRQSVVIDGRSIPLHRRCEASDLALTAGPVAVTGVAVDDPPRLIVPCAGMRPAPALVRAAGGHGGSTREPATAPLASPAAERTGTDPRRPVAAGLLLAGALALGAAAWLRRRARPGPDDNQPAVTEPEPATPPALTLVSVRTEHGP